MPFRYVENRIGVTIHIRLKKEESKFVIQKMKYNISFCVLLYASWRNIKFHVLYNISNGFLPRTRSDRRTNVSAPNHVGI